MTHDFKRFPELTNNQMPFYYLQSPHKQITESFHATVVNVHDGDTITVKWSQRDFTFPIRFANTAAPEMNEEGGKRAQEWLENIVLGNEVDIIVDPNKRVEKWGRLLGTIIHNGIDVGEAENSFGLSKPWEQRNEGKILNPIKGFK